jgi:hypothetical protein
VRDALCFRARAFHRCSRHRRQREHRGKGASPECTQVRGAPEAALEPFGDAAYQAVASVAAEGNVHVAQALDVEYRDGERRGIQRHRLEKPGHVLAESLAPIELREPLDNGVRRYGSLVGQRPQRLRELGRELIQQQQLLLAHHGVANATQRERTDRNAVHEQRQAQEGTRDLRAAALDRGERTVIVGEIETDIGLAGAQHEADAAFIESRPLRDVEGGFLAARGSGACPGYRVRDAGMRIHERDEGIAILLRGVDDVAGLFQQRAARADLASRSAQRREHLQRTGETPHALGGIGVRARQHAIGEHARDRRRKPRQVVLRHDIERAQLASLRGALLPQRSGNEDERRVGHFGRGDLERREAVEARHAEVGKDQVRLEAAQTLAKAPLGIHAFPHAVVARLLEEPGRDLCIRCLVIHDQKSDLPFHGVDATPCD